MDNCLFCQIRDGEIPGDKVYETEDVFAINDINPQAPVHILVIPKKHYDSLIEVEDNAEILGELLSAVKAIAREKGLENYNVVINTGADAGQTIPHLHLHLLGGKNMHFLEN